MICIIYPMFPRLGLCFTDPAKYLITDDVGSVDDLDRDLFGA